MKLLIIYGPPGAGKLTVGRRLAKKTGFRLLHSHQLAEAILPMFPYGAREFYPLMEMMRLEFVRAAARNGRIAGVILTGVYSPETAIDLSRKLIRKLSQIPRVRLFFVRLACREKELYRRIKHPSRLEFRKPRDGKLVKHLLRKYRVDAAMGIRQELTIDNTRISAEGCARRIRRHFRL